MYGKISDYVLGLILVFVNGEVFYMLLMLVDEVKVCVENIDGYGCIFF